MLKAIHAQENKEMALAKARAVAGKLGGMRVGQAALVREGIGQTLGHVEVPGHEPAGRAEGGAGRG
jgi:hypothetical protein